MQITAAKGLPIISPILFQFVLETI